MPPTVILIRHGQALHNINHKLSLKTPCLTRPAQEWEIPDPELSELGQQQCRTLEQHLRQHLPLADKVERIITSPMRRTLETTTLGLDWLIKRGIPVEASALWQGKSISPISDHPNLPDSHVTVSGLYIRAEARRSTVARFDLFLNIDECIDVAAFGTLSTSPVDRSGLYTDMPFRRPSDGGCYH
ncbi:hypothetical protein E4T47_04461 [Aureobasidium subglaciale]|nr:hypothetical protein E4T47_04461 [Aureobasidium subglaciale]